MLKGSVSSSYVTLTYSSYRIDYKKNELFDCLVAVMIGSLTNMTTNTTTNEEVNN